MGGVVSDMNKVWTDQEKIEVGRLASEGLSASQIAEKLELHDGVSDGHNKIIGLAHRNPDIIKLRGNPGAHRHPKPKGPKMPRAKRPKKSQTAAFMLKSSAQPDMKCQPLPPEPDVPADCEPITLLELTDETCRWPIGSRDYVFCGRRASGGPYCRLHSALAYQPRGCR